MRAVAVADVAVLKLKEVAVRPAHDRLGRPAVTGILRGGLPVCTTQKIVADPPSLLLTCKYRGKLGNRKPTDGIGVWVFDFAAWKAQSAGV
jgi:hypothetical protein